MGVTSVISIKNISKRFGGTQALNNITFDILPGEIHAIVGENGAGKSTLINILSGVYQQDQGEIYFEGQEVKDPTPRKMQDLGIATVHQELNLLPNRDVIHNIFLGSEVRKNKVFIDKRKMKEVSIDLLGKLGMNHLPEQRVGTLPIATQQLIEIAKAMLHKAKVVIMDEPNSALNDQESQKLFEVIHEMKAKGITIIYISHRIEEVLKLADRISVMRDGKHIKTLEAATTDEKELISLMLGHRFNQMFPPRDPAKKISAEYVLEIKKLSKEKKYSDVNLTVRKGEIVGIFGLEGSGRTEIAETLYGLYHQDQGEILIEATPVRIKSPQDAARRGIGYVPPDRKQEGVIANMSVGANIVMSVIDQLARWGKISQKTISAFAQDYIKRLSIKCSDLNEGILNLSGGNQQKAVLARALAIKPKIIILNEPTRGIDVGAKQEIYQLIFKMAKEGMSIILISSELEEIMALTDRIYVASLGKITAELDPEKTTKEEVLAFACGANAS